MKTIVSFMKVMEVFLLAILPVLAFSESPILPQAIKIT